MGYMPKVSIDNLLRIDYKLTMPLVAQIDVPAAEKKRKEFKAFRFEIYHAIWWEILKGLEVAAKYGEGIICGDRVARTFFPGVYILSMDFEEQ